MSFVYKETNISSLFSCCTLFCTFLVELLRLNPFSTTGVELKQWCCCPWTSAESSLCRELLRMRSVRAAEKVFPASPVSVVGLYRWAVQSMPVEVCGALDNSRDGRRPHTPNIYSSGTKHQGENISLKPKERISFLWMMDFGSCEKRKANWFNSN